MRAWRVAQSAIGACPSSPPAVDACPSFPRVPVSSAPVLPPRRFAPRWCLSRFAGSLRGWCLSWFAAPRFGSAPLVPVPVRFRFGSPVGACPGSTAARGCLSWFAVVPVPVRPWCLSRFARSWCLSRFARSVPVSSRRFAPLLVPVPVRSPRPGSLRSLVPVPVSLLGSLVRSVRSGCPGSLGSGSLRARFAARAGSQAPVLPRAGGAPRPDQAPARSAAVASTSIASVTGSIATP